MLLAQDFTLFKLTNFTVDHGKQQVPDIMDFNEYIFNLKDTNKSVVMTFEFRRPQDSKSHYMAIPTLHQDMKD